MGNVTFIKIEDLAVSPRAGAFIEVGLTEIFADIDFLWSISPNVSVKEIRRVLADKKVGLQLLVLILKLGFYPGRIYFKVSLFLWIFRDQIQYLLLINLLQ